MNERERDTYTHTHTHTHTHRANDCINATFHKVMYSIKPARLPFTVYNESIQQLALIKSLIVSPLPLYDINDKHVHLIAHLFGKKCECLYLPCQQLHSECTHIYMYGIIMKILFERY